MFLQASVCPRGRVSASVHAGIPSPQEQTQPPPPHPRSRHLPEQTPPEQSPPRADTPLEQTPSRSRHPPPGSRHTQPPPLSRPPPPSRDRRLLLRTERILLECIHFSFSCIIRQIVCHVNGVRVTPWISTDVPKNTNSSYSQISTVMVTENVIVTSLITNPNTEGSSTADCMWTTNLITVYSSSKNTEFLVFLFEFLHNWF